MGYLATHFHIKWTFSFPHTVAPGSEKSPLSNNYTQINHLCNE